MVLVGSLTQVLSGLAVLVLVVLAVMLVRAKLGKSVIEDADSVVAISAAIIAVYGLILGLTLAAAWDRYQRADEILVSELNSIFVLFRMADMWEAEGGGELQRALTDYGDAVIANELDGRGYLVEDGAPARAALRRAYAALSEITKGPGGDLGSINNAWERISDLDNARGVRLTLTRQALPVQFWIVLYLGGVLSLATLVMIHPVNRNLHLTFSIAAALLIVTSLILLKDLDTPLSGTSTVDFDGFRRGIEILKAP